MSPETNNPHPQRTIESLGLDPNDPNDRLIIEGAHNDFRMALYMLEKEDLISRAHDPEFMGSEAGMRRYSRLLENLDENILQRETALGFGRPNTEQP